MFNHVIHQCAINKRKLRKVIFIWSVRDKLIIESVTKTHKNALNANESIEGGARITEGGISGFLKQEELPLSFQPNMINFSSKMTLTAAAIKAHIENSKTSMLDPRGSKFLKQNHKTSVGMSDNMLDNDEMSDIRLSENEEMPDFVKNSLSNLSFSTGVNEKATTDIFHCEFYLTQAR